MAAARILIVEHEALAGAALIGQRLAMRDLAVTICGPATGVPVPHEVGDYTGVIVLGGSMGPTDDDLAPWLPAARDLLRDAVRSQTPLLAVCLGAQLLATAMGGTVEPMTTPEVGTASVQLTSAGRTDPLLADLPAEAPTLHWHWLHVTQLPTGATVLATNDATPVQAYRVGDRAWATQFHLEADEATAADWAQEMGAELPAAGFDPDQILRDWAARHEQAEHVWSTVIDRWIDIAASAVKDDEQPRLGRADST